MSKNNIIIGGRLSFDEIEKTVYITVEDVANVIEANVLGAEYELNDKTETSVSYDCLFSGTVTIDIEDMPCYLVKNTGLPLPLKEENQTNLFNQQNSEERTVAKKYYQFVPEEYEKHKEAGSKYRPETGLSKKKSKKFHAERRDYESTKGYPSMYPSEGASGVPVETAQQSTEQVSKEAIAKNLGIKPEEVEITPLNPLLTEEMVDKINAAIEELPKPVDIPSDLGTKVEETKEETVDMAKDSEFVGTLPDGDKSLNLDIGDKNTFTIFGEVWDGFVIAYHHKADNVYTIASTKESPASKKKYYLVFTKEDIAKYALDKMGENGDLGEQIKDADVYRLGTILQEDLKSIPCVRITNAISYLNSIGG